MKIAVVGLGYVGTAFAVLLAPHHEVVGYDINAQRVADLDEGRSPVADPEVERWLSERDDLSLTATNDITTAFEGARFVIVATPTNYDQTMGSFDTSSVESVIANVAEVAPTAHVVVKSTVPVGFTRRMQQRHPDLTILFSPEFLREGQALTDNLHPSRIVIGDPGPAAAEFAKIAADAALDPDPPIMVVGATEAEAIKLFSNTYLALRVAYFNELDSYAANHSLDSQAIIAGVGLDPRIGDHYNNPSFGYGGYCLPKDTQQLLANYRDVPQHIIGAVVDSNETRKDFVAASIAARNPSTVGIHRLTMKTGSDNFRDSSIIGIAERLLARGIKVVLYEPLYPDKRFLGAKVIASFEEFTAMSDVIVTNRWAPELAPYADKVFTRDLFRDN